MTGFLLAAGFLTALPVPGLAGRSFEPSAFARATGWFPLVGLLLGAALAVVDAGLRWLLPGGVAAALLIGVAAAMTGGLHWDGLMDACDGVLGRHDRGRRLEIMRDSRIGAFGALGAGCALLVEWSAIDALPSADRGSWLVAAFGLSRWTMVWLIAAYPYARPSGLGAAFRGVDRRVVAVASLTALAGAAAAAGWPGLIISAGSLVVGATLAGFAVRRLGGLTGDLYGAIGLLCEIGVLVAGTRLAAQPWWR